MSSSSSSSFLQEVGTQFESVLDPLKGKLVMKCTYSKACDYKTDKNSNFLRHWRTMHKKLKVPLKCCGFSYPTKGEYRHHTRTVHVDGHRCSICARNFTRRALLDRHMSTHTGDKPFKCTTCKYSSANKANVLRHMTTHSKSSSDPPTPKSSPPEDDDDRVTSTSNSESIVDPSSSSSSSCLQHEEEEAKGPPTPISSKISHSIESILAPDLNKSHPAPRPNTFTSHPYYWHPSADPSQDVEATVLPHHHHLLVNCHPHTSTSTSQGYRKLEPRSFLPPSNLSISQVSSTPPPPDAFTIRSTAAEDEEEKRPCNPNRKPSSSPHHLLQNKKKRKMMNDEDEGLALQLYLTFGNNNNGNGGDLHPQQNQGFQQQVPDSFFGRKLDEDAHCSDGNQIQPAVVTASSSSSNYGGSFWYNDGMMVPGQTSNNSANANYPCCELGNSQREEDSESQYYNYIPKKFRKVSKS